MKNIINHLKDKFFEFSVEKGILILVSFFGISTLSVIASFNTLFHNQIILTVGVLMGIVFGLVGLNIIGYYVQKKMRNKQCLSNGTIVILKTDRLPKMIVSEYSFFKNKVLCVWQDKNETKESWFKQEVLKEYQSSGSSEIRYGSFKNKHSW